MYQEVFIDKRWSRGFELSQNNTKDNPVFSIKGNRILFNSKFFSVISKKQRYFLIRWAFHQYHIKNTNNAAYLALMDYFNLPGSSKSEIAELLTIKIPVEYWLSVEGNVEKVEYLLRVINEY